MGAARRDARGAAEHRDPDAAARPQHGRLHAVPDRGHGRLRARGRGDRRRHLPHLRRAQRRRPAAARRRGGARDRHRRRRGRALLHRRPARPGRGPLHARLLPAARRRDGRRRAPTSWRSRTWRGCCAPAPPRSSSPPCASASTCPCTCTRTTRQAASSPPCSPRAAPAPTRSTSPAPRWPAPPASRACRRSSPRPRTPSATPASRLQAVSDLEPYWEAVRKVYKPFESGLPGPTGRVYRHEIPGGQLSNLRQQAIALGLGDRFEVIEDLYAAASDILGRPPKVTPSSKVVGDLALALAAADADPADFEKNPDKYDIPDSVVGFMAGELGDLPGGWPEPFRTKVLKGRDVKIGVEELTPTRRRALAGDARRAPHGPQPAALRRARRRRSSRCASSTATCRSLDTPDYLYGLQPGRRALGDDRPGREPVRRARGDRRGRRQGHAHRHDDAQRPAAPGVRARSRHHGREQGGREGGCRPGRAGRARRSPASSRSRSPRATRSRPVSRSRRSRR